MSRTANWRVPLGIQSLVAQSAWAGVRLMAGYQALALGAGPALLALMTTVFAAPALAAAVPAGRLSDRFGGSVLSLSGAVLGAVGTVGLLFVPGIPGLIACCAVIGLGNLGSMVGQQTFVAHLAQRGSGDSSFGFLSATASAGQALGPLLATTAATMLVLDPSQPDTTLGLIVCAVLTVVGIPFYPMMRGLEASSLKQHKPSRTQRKTSQLSLARSVWPALVVSGFVLVTIDLLYTFMPLWGQVRGVSANAIGFLLALRAGVSMISRLGLGSLVAQWGRTRLMVMATALAALALASLPFSNIWWAALAMVVLGMGLGIPQPLTMAWSVAVTDRSNHGAVLGLRLSANRLALILVPMLLGAVTVPWGAMSVFYINSGLLVVSAAIASRTPEADE